MPIKDPHGKRLREHVIYLLNGGGAHVRFDDVVKNMPEELRGIRPDGLPHSAWMLLEHLRMAQWDILENISLRNGPRDIGRRQKLRRIQPRGIRIFNSSARI